LLKNRQKDLYLSNIKQLYIKRAVLEGWSCRTPLHNGAYRSWPPEKWSEWKRYICESST